MRGTRALWLLVAIGLVVVLRCAWVNEDAYITLRTVDNVVNGRGLTWNPGERVQVYTHPLWMMLLTLVYAFTREAYYTLCFVSLAVTALFLASFVRLHGAKVAPAALALGTLVASKSFVDYATSGLENPMTHLLLCLAYAVHWRGVADGKALFRLALICALGALNRADTLLLFLPPLLLDAFRCGRTLGWRRVTGALALGFAPLVAWEAFSLLYYGMLVPNTAYAKLNTGLPASDYVARGVSYFLSSLSADPVAFLAMGLALVLSVGRGDRALRPAAVAIALWMLYLLRIGGDFMVGRHFTPPLVLACLALAHSTALHGRRVAVCGGLVLACGLLAPLSPLRSGRDYGPQAMVRLGRFRMQGGVADERGNYFQETGLLRLRYETGPMDHRRARQGERYRLRVEAGPRPTDPVILGAIGLLGYYAGPEVRILDCFALADPLLARLPMADVRWRIGHHPREIPAGYVETVKTGRNRIADPDLARYYDRLALVVRGDLWSRERLVAIWGLLTGRYDERLDAYVARIEAGTAKPDPLSPSQRRKRPAADEPAQPARSE